MFPHFSTDKSDGILRLKPNIFQTPPQPLYLLKLNSSSSIFHLSKNNILSLFLTEFDGISSSHHRHKQSQLVLPSKYILNPFVALQP